MEETCLSRLQICSKNATIILNYLKGDTNMLWDLIWSILIGALVGWVAGIIMKSKGGFVRNAIMGILGGVVAGILLPDWLPGRDP